MNDRRNIVNQIQDLLGPCASAKMAEQLFDVLRADDRIYYTDADGLVLRDDVDLTAAVEEVERAALKPRVQALRSALRDRFGAGKYKITGHIGVTEQVHIYGRMPNSNQVGWWLMGDMAAAEAWVGL